jgi:predicted ArsR family transcriptional regulator
MDKFYEDEEIRDATRLHNRALRTVNKSLRKQAEIAKQQTDEIVAALFDAPAPTNAAEEALRKLWEEGGYAPFCSPEDYDKLVDHAIESMKFSRDILNTARNQFQHECAVSGNTPDSVSVKIRVGSLTSEATCQPKVLKIDAPV